MHPGALCYAHEHAAGAFILSGPPERDSALRAGLNLAALYGIGALLAGAFGMQLALGELPCPLCMMQRALLGALAIGPMLNLRLGERPAHYGLTILSALAGAAVSARQVLLHIRPGDPGYGMPVLGLHLYTWALVVFLVALVLAACMLLNARAFGGEPARRATGWATGIGLGLAPAVLAANALSTALMCGLQACPADPVRYELLQRLSSPQSPPAPQAQEGAGTSGGSQPQALAGTGERS